MLRPSNNLAGYESTPDLGAAMRYRVPENGALSRKISRHVNGNVSTIGLNTLPISARPHTLDPYAHNREPSGSTTYNVLNYYTGESESEIDSDSNRVIDGDADYNTNGGHSINQDTYNKQSIDQNTTNKQSINHNTTNKQSITHNTTNKQSITHNTPNKHNPGQDTHLDHDTMVYSGSAEPFTMISSDEVHQPAGKAARKTSDGRITKKESYAALQLSRTSLERVRTQMDRLMSTDEESRQPQREGTTRNRILKGHEDRYGFRKSSTFVSEDQFNSWWARYSKYLIRRKRKWVRMMAKNGLPTSNDSVPSRFPPRSDNLRKFVRKGIPAEWRGAAWFYFARGNEKLKQNRGVYDRLVDQTMDIVNENTEAIEKDLHRTFPENVHFKNVSHRTDDGAVEEAESPLLQTLRRVLKCFAIYKPDIGYCQSLNFIAGLLLIYMDEEKAFWMLVIISERYLPGIHDFNLEGVSVHQGVLMLCLRRYLPQIWEMIINSGDTRYQEGSNSFLYDLPTLSFCTTSWFMSIFIGVLPMETTLRVWDCLFYEDSKTIFQISLEIFQLMEPDLKRIFKKNQGEGKEVVSSELFREIQNFPKKLLDANRLIDECFRHSSFKRLTQDEVNKCKQYVVDSRARYCSLIKKRSALGLKESDRKELVKKSEKLLDDEIGLKTLNWNGRLNHRMRKLHRKLR